MCYPSQTNPRLLYSVFLHVKAAWDDLWLLSSTSKEQQQTWFHKRLLPPQFQLLGDLSVGFLWQISLQPSKTRYVEIYLQVFHTTSFSVTKIRFTQTSQSLAQLSSQGYNIIWTWMCHIQTWMTSVQLEKNWDALRWRLGERR